MFFQRHSLPVLSWLVRPCLKSFAVCEDTNSTHGRQGRQAEAVGCCVKCWAHNAKCPEDSQLPSASSCTLKCSEYGLAGPAWTCSSSAACRRRIHGSCCGPICTILANQSSVATQSLKAVLSLHFCSQPAYCPQTSLGCFCLD